MPDAEFRKHEREIMRQFGADRPQPGYGPQTAPEPAVEATPAPESEPSSTRRFTDEEIGAMSDAEWKKNEPEFRRQLDAHYLGVAASEPANRTVAARAHGTFVVPETVAEGAWPPIPAGTSPAAEQMIRELRETLNATGAEARLIARFAGLID